MPTLIGLMAAVGILRASGFGFYFRVAWKINGGDRISDRADPGCCGKNVFFLCSNGTFTGYLQNTWCRFDAGTCGIGYAQQHRDHFYTMSVYFMSVKVKRQDIHFWELFLQPLPELWQVYFLCGKPEVVRIVLLFAWQPVCSSKIVKNIRIMIEIC